MARELLFRPVFSVLSILGGCVLLAVLAFVVWWRARRTAPVWSVALLAMRLTAIAAVGLLLMGPSAVLQDPQTQARSRLLLLLDTSESMRVADCDSSPRIVRAVRELLEPRRLAALERDFEIDLLGFDETVHPVSMSSLRERPEAQANGRQTNLVKLVTSTILERAGDGTALLVISDGRDSGGDAVQPAAAAAAVRRVPIFTATLGGAATTPDAALVAVPMQDSLMPDEAGSLLLRVYQSGLQGESGTVRVQQGDRESRYSVKFDTGRVFELQAPIQESEPGSYDYRVSLDAVGTETELSNNEQHVFVEVMKRRLRVLVLEGQPYWDTKFLVQSLRKDEQVDIVQLTQMRPSRREAVLTRDSGEAPRLPESAEAWAAFDVVIVGRGLELFLQDEGGRQLSEYVLNGGNLVFARGEPCDAASPEGERLMKVMAPVLPVVWSQESETAATLSLTSSGRTGSWLNPARMHDHPEEAFARLPPLESLDRVRSLKPGTVIIADARTEEQSGVEQPAIVRMSAGRGVVTAILGEGTWKWSLLTPDIQDLRGFYDQFWSNLVRWLALGGDFPPGQQTSLQLSRASVRLGDEQIVDVVYRFAPDGLAEPRVTIVDSLEHSSEIALHRQPGAALRFRGAFLPQTTGVHQVLADAPGMSPAHLEGRFNVYDVNLERLQTAADPAAMALLSTLSGGATIDPSEPDALSTHLARHRLSMVSPPRTEFLWDRTAFMLGLLLWMGLEWLLRRNAGLW